MFSGVCVKHRRIHAVWSAPLFFAFWKVSNPNLLQTKFQLSRNSVAEQAGLNLTLSEIPKTGFLAMRPIWSVEIWLQGICILLAVDQIWFTFGLNDNWAAAWDFQQFDILTSLRRFSAIVF